MVTKDTDITQDTGIASMYYIIQNPGDGKNYLCERETDGFLHIWDEEGNEVLVFGVPWHSGWKNLVRRFQVSSALRCGEKKAIASAYSHDLTSVSPSNLQNI